MDEDSPPLRSIACILRIANWREYEHVSPIDWEELVGENRF
jgi:hypothetical protein